jgi:hypothetical protein
VTQVEPTVDILCFQPSAAERRHEEGLRPSPPNELEYFRQRERMERAAAKNATSAQARGIHQELAQVYAKRSRSEG